MILLSYYYCYYEHGNNYKDEIGLTPFHEILKWKVALLLLGDKNPHLEVEESWEVE